MGSTAGTKPLSANATSIEKVEQAVKDDERVQPLTTEPSVGAVAAATFIAIVDDVGRFESSHKLQSNMGLVPRA